MVRQIFYSGLLAGVIAGLFLFGAQQLRLVPLVLEAEVFENAAAAPAGANGAADAEVAGVLAADGLASGDGFGRIAFSLLSNVVTAVGFGLVLAGVMALSRREIDWRQGVVWGLAGYLAVHLSPALGLPPELPGMATEADLIARQTWAMATTVLTAAGLALLAFPKNRLLKLLGVVAIVLPHIVGVQGRVHVEHDVPADLVAQFIVATLVITALFWAFLGGLTSYFFARTRAR